jgi:hypothetical protein
LQYIPHPIGPACASIDSISIIALTYHMPRCFVSASTAGARWGVEPAKTPVQQLIAGKEPPHT